MPSRAMPQRCSWLHDQALGGRSEVQGQHPETSHTDHLGGKQLIYFLTSLFCASVPRLAAQVGELSVAADVHRGIAKQDVAC
jgi:hypothetical protein